MVVAEDQFIFFNFVGDLTFCDAETVKELDRIGRNLPLEIKETPVPTKKVVNEKERAYNLDYNENYKNKNALKKETLYLKRLIIPIKFPKEEGTVIESKLDISDDVKKILYTPCYIPKNYRCTNTYDKPNTLKLNKKFCLGYTSNLINNLIYNKNKNWIAYTINNKVTIN